MKKLSDNKNFGAKQLLFKLDYLCTFEWVTLKKLLEEEKDPIRKFIELCEVVDIDPPTATALYPMAKQLYDLTKGW